MVDLKNSVDLTKRNSLKKAAIGAAAVGVGLVGLSSVANASGIIFRENGTDVSVNELSTQSFGVTIDGGSSAITTGVAGYVQIPYDCIIKSWTLLADQSGSIVLDVWKSAYANSPPTVANTITASAKPTLSSVQKNTDSTLTGWTTSVSAGDVIGFNIDSAATVTKVTLSIKVEKV
ncbi:MAG: hypothetical protein WCW44_01255 [archaeon]|jgi:hypothetical protein